MPKHIVYDLAREGAVVFEYSPDAYLAVIDLDSYSFFVSPELGYDGMLAHLGQQRVKRTCVAWGCPEVDLEIRIIFTRDHEALESVSEYGAGFQGWIRTKGRLCFACHRDLYHCATSSESSVFKGAEPPNSFAPRELVVPPGTYSVIVFRHFGWFEGDQDAPLLNNGINYTVILRYYPEDQTDYLLRHCGSSAVPWTSE